jgi:hypothetical protein
MSISKHLSTAASASPFDRIWYWRSRLPERKGQACRILARGRLNTTLVEFEDGHKVITSRYAVRRLLDSEPSLQ